MNRYPTTRWPCEAAGCGEVAESADPHVDADRMICIPYHCPVGHEFVRRLPGLTDMRRRNAHQLASRSAAEVARAAAAMHDPAEVARAFEELSRRRVMIEAERIENERQHAIVAEGMRIKAEADAANAAAEAAALTALAESMTIAGESAEEAAAMEAAAMEAAAEGVDAIAMAAAEAAEG